MISIPFDRVETKKASIKKPRSLEDFLKMQPSVFGEAPIGLELRESPENLLPCDNFHSNL